jgi:hypothetical protein
MFVQDLLVFEVRCLRVRRGAGVPIERQSSAPAIHNVVYCVDIKGEMGGRKLTTVFCEHPTGRIKRDRGRLVFAEEHAHALRVTVRLADLHFAPVLIDLVGHRKNRPAGID